MFERFRKSDRGPEEPVTVADTPATTASAREGGAPTTVWRRDDEPATTPLDDRDDDAATTVHERTETPVRDDEDAPATTLHDRGATMRDRDEDRLAALREDAPATPVPDRDRDDATRVREPSDRFARDDVREPRTLAPVVGDETLVAMHDRQRIRFGGFSWGSAFFGLLSAIGLAALLLGIVAAAGVAIGVSEIENVTNGDADTIGLGGAILVLAILALSWFCGGYVAGRMARFDGIRQGLAVWLWTVVIGAALAIAAVIGGSEYDVFARLNLPNVAVGDQTLTTGGAITLAAACVVTLVFALLGGKVGDRFHRRVDRFAAREYVETP